MVLYKCSCCNFKTEIKQHYQRHEKTKKHQQFVEAYKHNGQEMKPPTELEQLRLEIRQLREINAELRRQ